MIRQYELVERVKNYDPAADEQLLNRAYVFSMRAHGNQTRHSGDPYFSHPLEVAGILTDLKLDDASVATGLLHDTLEDTLATPEDLRSQFGAEVATLVDGVTKLSKLELVSETSQQAENLRKFFLAMSDDIRVLLVKLADRLHNMRTLHFIPSEEKRRRIALETMEIYAPLAERIGMQTMKVELEDLAFRTLNPDAWQSVTTRLDFLKDEAGKLEETVTRQFKQTLADAGIEAIVFSRVKQPYSIWRKMQRDNVSFEQLGDVMGFRIIVADRKTCYQALGAVHASYPMVPQRFKDYISTPKRNNYQSIHTTVIGPEQQRIEIQIRSREMHQIASYGVAAHWQYKQEADEEDPHQYRWLQGILEILEQASSPEEFLEHTKVELFADQVFCFTPKGEVVALPRGATPIDFAYAVHTDVGNTCVGAKVNGRLVPLRTQLQNGDQVEVVRSTGQTPPKVWENIVVTGRARSAIRRYWRQQGRSEYILVGQNALERIFVRHGYDLTNKSLEHVLPSFNVKTRDDLLEKVGSGSISARQVLEAVFPGEKSSRQRVFEVPLLASGAPAKAIAFKGANPGTTVDIATCCNPLPGERIVGIIEDGKLVVHAIDCDGLSAHDDSADDWVDVTWERDAVSSLHMSRIALRCNNEPGTLGQIATLLGKNGANISNLRLTERQVAYFTLTVDLEVRDLQHLTNIIAALRALNVVQAVDRMRNQGE